MITTTETEAFSPSVSTNMVRTGINERMQRSANRFIHKWESLQVELHGHYFIERFTAMNEYSRATSFWRALVMLPLTPLPCFILVALIDSIPLEDPERGFKHSAASWIRATLTCFIYTHCAIEQIRLYTPNLKLTPSAGFFVSFPAAILTNVLALILSASICWPLPFVSILMSGPWLGFTTFFLLRVCGNRMRLDPEAVKDVVRFATICGAQVLIILIYTVLNTIFTNMSSTYQPMFALLIPAFKILQKNVLSRILAGCDDTKPQVNSQSISTSITLIAVDILQAAISLLDLYRMVNDVKKILGKLGADNNALISSAELVLDNYPDTANRRPTTTQNEPNFWAINSTPQTARISLKKKQVLPTMNMKVGEYKIPIPITQHLSLQDASRVSSAQHSSTKKATDVTSARPTTGLNRLSSHEHYRLLKKALQVLFLTEFMLLIEFTEVLVPIIYGGYLVIMYHFSNRRFYPQLADRSDDKLWGMVVSVLVYGMFELASLILLIAVLNRLVYRQSLKQLAFVLEREFFMVQPKLILWVVMTMQSTLPQLGVDYNFKFAWIHSNNSSDA